MVEARYFVYVGGSTYTKIASDGKKIYSFKPGEAVEVVSATDQSKFAGDSSFFESNKGGDSLSTAAGALPGNNPVAGKGTPLSYMKVLVKGAAKAAPAPSVEKKVEEVVEEPKKKSGKKSSKKKED